MTQGRSGTVPGARDTSRVLGTPPVLCACVHADTSMQKETYSPDGYGRRFHPSDVFTEKEKQKSL